LHTLHEVLLFGIIALSIAATAFSAWLAGEPQGAGGTKQQQPRLDRANLALAAANRVARKLQLLRYPMTFARPCAR